MGMAYNPLDKPYLLFLLGFGVITLYIPGIIGATISTGWLFLLIVAPIFFLYCDFKIGLGFAFLCYAALSLLWTEVLNIAWFHFLQLVVLSLVFVIGQNVKDLTSIFKGLAFGLGISALVAIGQKLGVSSVYTLNNAVAGLFINPNILSEISAVLLVSLIIFKLWWWIPVTLPGLLLVQSRAAFLALGVGLLIWGWKSYRTVTIIAVLVLTVLAFRFYGTNFSITSIQERLDLWVDTIQGFKFFGNGVGSYEALFPLNATHINTEMARPRYAHNDLLHWFFEFGVGSILILMVMWNVFTVRKPEVVIVYTIFIVSLFTYPMHVPTQAFIAFLVAGYLSSNSYTYRDNRGYLRSNVPERFIGKGYFKARTS